MQRSNPAGFINPPPVREKNGGALPRAVLPLLSQMRQKHSAHYGGIGGIPTRTHPMHTWKAR